MCGPPEGGEGGWGEIIAPPQNFFLFRDLEIGILVNSEVLNLKYVIILGIFPLTSPNKIIGGCVPGIPGGVDVSVYKRAVPSDLCAQ